MAKGIHNRALKQPDASRAEAAEAKSLLKDRQIHEHAKACTTDQSVRNFKDGLGTNMTTYNFSSRFWTE